MTSLRPLNRLFSLRVFAPIVSLALVAGSLAFARPASADDTKTVVVSPTGLEPRCLDVGELLLAVRRDTGFAPRLATPASPAPPATPNMPVVWVTSTDEGAPLVHIARGGGNDVHQALPAPSCDATTDVVAAFVASTLAPFATAAPLATAPAEASPDAPASPETSARAELLAAALYPHRNGRNWLGWSVGGLLILEGGIFTGLGVAIRGTEPPSAAALTIAGGGTMIGAGIASYVVSDDYQRTTVGVGMSAGLGILALGLEGARQHGGNRDFDVVPGSLALLGAGSLGSALMLTIDARVHPPVGEERLARAYAKLATPAQRNTISPRELAATEAEYLDSGSHLSPWLMNMPNLVTGAAITVLGAVRLGQSPDSSGGKLTTVFGAIDLGFSLLNCFIDPSPETTAYKRALKRRGLEVSVTPTVGGISVSGRF